MKKVLNNKNIKIISLVVVFLVVAVVTILLLNKGNKSIVDTKGKVEKIDTEKSISLYSLITDVNCDNTLVFDFGSKDEILVKDFTKEQRLNLIFRYLELNNKLEGTSKSDFDDAVNKVFGPSFSEEFDLKDFKYKNKTYSSNGSTLDSQASSECNSNVVTKNFSFSPNEIGIELGIKKDNKLYTIDNVLVGEFDSEESMNELLDSSTAYYYKYDFNGEQEYLVKVTPLIKVKGIKK